MKIDPIYNPRQTQLLSPDLQAFRSETDVDTGKSTTTLLAEKSGSILQKEKSGSTLQTGSDDTSVVHFLKKLHTEASRTTTSTSGTSVSTESSQPAVTPAANRTGTPASNR